MGEDSVDEDRVGKMGGRAEGGEETEQVAIADGGAEGEVTVCFFFIFKTFVLGNQGLLSWNPYFPFHSILLLDFPLA